MTTRRTDMTRRDEAQRRLYLAAAGLQLGPTFVDMPLRVTDQIETAVWCYNRTTDMAEIRVNIDLAETLPLDMLQALLLHELLHHLGFNERRHVFPVTAPPGRVNLALDIALERVLTQTPFADALNRLNQRLLVEPLPDAPLTLPDEQAVVLLCHAAPPTERLSPRLRELWETLWSDPTHPLAPEEIDRLLAGVVERGGPVFDKSVRVMTEYDEQADTPVELVVRDIDPTPQTDIAHGRETDRGDESDGDHETPRQDHHSTGRHQADWSAIRPRKNELSDGPTDWSTAVQTAAPWLVGREPSSLSGTGGRAGTRRERKGRRHTGWARHAVRDLFGSEPRAKRLARLPYLVRPTRQELVRRAVGWPAVLYANHRFRTLPPPVAVYVDISRSMQSASRRVLQFLRSVRAQLPSRLYLFNSLVVPVPRDTLLGEEYFQGGGTNFNQVFRDAMAREHREAVMVTDGQSWVNDDLLAEFRAAGHTMNALLFLHEDQSNAPEIADAPWWNHSVIVPLDPGDQLGKTPARGDASDRKPLEYKVMQRVLWVRCEPLDDGYIRRAEGPRRSNGT